MQDKPVLLMKKVINLFFRELDAMNTEKLQEPISGHNMIVIEYLTKHEEPVYQRDLENHFFVRRSTVSKVLRLMEEKGMIERLSVPVSYTHLDVYKRQGFCHTCSAYKKIPKTHRIFGNK